MGGEKMRFRLKGIPIFAAWVVPFVAEILFFFEQLYSCAVGSKLTHVVPYLSQPPLQHEKNSL